MNCKLTEFVNVINLELNKDKMSPVSKKIINKFLKNLNNIRSKNSIGVDKNINGFLGYVGGFKNAGKGTPKGDGKDIAMRKTATGFIGELLNVRKSSSTKTSYEHFDHMYKLRQSTAVGITNKTAQARARGPHNSIIMLARNGSLKGTALDEMTTKAIDDAAEDPSTTFLVGDMPNVDSQFISYLDKIGANYKIYHTGNKPRIQKEIKSKEQQQKSDTIDKKIPEICPRIYK